MDRLLVAQLPNASAEARQQHLKLLMEVYKRTHALAEQLQVCRWPPLSCLDCCCSLRPVQHRDV